MNRFTKPANIPLKSIKNLDNVNNNDLSDFWIRDFTVQNLKEHSDENVYNKVIKSLNRSTLVYAIGGILYAVILTSGWMIAAKAPFALSRSLWLFICFGWPTIITVNLINPLLRRQISYFYLTVLLLIACIVLILCPDSIFDLIKSWLVLNIPATILLGLFINKRVRAVGPLVLVIIISGITGAEVFLSVVGGSNNLLTSFVKVASLLGVGALTLFLAFFFIGFGILSFLGWQLLRWLGHRYIKKKLSDQSLTLDSLWLLFGIIQSFTLINEEWGLIFIGLVAFVFYKVATFFGFRVYNKQYSNVSEGNRLLLLRVFSLGRRSERLFDSISKVWLRYGCINLIAGPDLVTTTVEPHEFLNFMGGHLSRQFFSDEKDLEQQVSKLDTLPDPDGRHRVNEFFCHADTWQMAIQKLAMVSNIVLMDLRSFSKKNQGCIYELQNVLNYSPFNQIVLIIDKLTDKVFLEDTIKSIKCQIVNSSPESKKKNRIIRLFTLKEGNLTEIKNLLKIMFISRQGI